MSFNTATERTEMNTGSLTNMLYDGATNPAKPEVGMGCTLVRWTDRHAATVVEVSKSGHKIVVQRDSAKRADENGMSDAQEWTFERDPNGALETYTRRQDGSYRIVGGKGRCLIGRREHYFDFSF